jgi:hypothetical protein
LEALSGCVAHSASAPASRGTSHAASRTRANASTKNSASDVPGITPEHYLAHVSLLAHDELGGRGTGSDGIDMAAGYVAGQFAAADLLPGGPAGTYFQPFTIPSDPKLKAETRFTVQGRTEQPVLRQDYVPFGFSAKGSFEGEVVFVGYGISDADHNYDDYAGMDVADKVILMLRREPPGLAEGSRFSRHATFESKMKLAAEKGAIAVLIANQEPAADDIDSLTPFGGRAKPESIPALHVSRGLANELATSGGLPSLSDLQKVLDEEHCNVSAALKDVSVNGEVAYESTDILARNVIGVLPGLGPHAKDFIVIGGHYDHLGTRRGDIHNGADDNASGSAGVIEVCRALAQASYRDRSLLCMTFTGEEMGLLGSAHFVKDPTVPLDAIVAMINMDMIGRWNPDDEDNKLGIQGLGTGATFKEIVDRRTAEAGIEFLPDPSARGPSDHASFYEAGIPSLFFFTGVHSDYHQPGDDVEKINAEGGARIATLVSRIALDVINAEAPPVFAKVNQPAKIFRGAAGLGGGVVMGVMPDMEDESNEPGWRIAGVMPGGGADKAGMKSGDRIVRIGDQPINTMSDYRKATTDKKAGDVISVIVRRGKEELTLNVELASRG